MTVNGNASAASEHRILDAGHLQGLENGADARSTKSNHSYKTNDNNVTITSGDLNWLDMEAKRTSPLTAIIGHSMNKNCENFSLKKSFLSLVPLLQRLQGYSLKRDLVADIIAGITVAILQIPQGIAYALLVGVGPAYGLYTSFFPVLIYAFLGSAQHISIGTMAVVDIMLRDMMDKYVETNSTLMPPEGSFEDMNLGDPSKIQVMMSICLLTGLCQMLFGLLHLGAVSLILSDQLISGFSCGAAINVILSQVPTALEMTGVSKASGPLSLVYQAVSIVKNLHTCNKTALILSAIALVVCVFYKEVLDPSLKKKVPFPIPIDLIIVIAATCACTYLNLSRKYDVAIMGNIPTGLPFPKLPVLDMKTLKSGMLVDAVILAVVCFAIALSLGKIYAKKHGYAVRANQEFLSLGAANAFGSFFSCFPATASLSRTATMGEYAISHVSSLVSCVVLLFVLLILAPALSNLPKSVVAVIIIVAQKTMVMQVRNCKESWKISRWEGMIWIVTFVCVLLLGLDFGLLGGIAFSIFTIVLRFSNPKLRRLGQLTDTEIFLDINQHRNAMELAGVKILQFSSPLFFLNKDLFRESVVKKCIGGQKFRGNNNCEYGAVRIVIVDCSAMSFVDSAGVATIIELSKELKEAGIEVVLASCPPAVLSTFNKIKLRQKAPNTLIFPSVQDAIHRIRVEQPERLHDLF